MQNRMGAAILIACLVLCISPALGMSAERSQAGEPATTEASVNHEEIECRLIVRFLRNGEVSAAQFYQLISRAVCSQIIADFSKTESALVNTNEGEEEPQIGMKKIIRHLLLKSARQCSKLEEWSSSVDTLSSLFPSLNGQDMQNFIKIIKYPMAYRGAIFLEYLETNPARIWAKDLFGEEWLGGESAKIYKELFNYVDPVTKKLNQEMLQIFLRDYSEHDIEEARRAVHLVSLQLNFAHNNKIEKQVEKASRPLPPSWGPLALSTLLWVCSIPTNFIAAGTLSAVIFAGKKLSDYTCRTILNGTMQHDEITKINDMKAFLNTYIIQLRQRAQPRSSEDRRDGRNARRVNPY